MINDSFMLQNPKRSGTISFRLNDTIQPTLALLNLEFDLPLTLSMFESRFTFFNHDFVCGIKDLPYQAFRHRFLNFEHHNERYQQLFFNDFLGRGHCTKTCEICIEHDSARYSRVNYELSRYRANYLDPESDNTNFRPFSQYETDNQLFRCYTPAVLYHKCIHSCTLPAVNKPHFDCFSYESLLIYAYYTNLTSKDKALFEKCHSHDNDILEILTDNDILEILTDILTEMLGPNYGFPHLIMITILKLPIRELKMVKTNLLPVGLDLDIDFKLYPGLINHKLFFPALSFTNKSKFTNLFLN